MQVRKEKKYFFSFSVRHFFALKRNPTSWLPLGANKKQQSVLLQYQEHPIILHVLPAIAKWGTYNIFPSMRAIQASSHKMNHKKVSISQKECRIHNVKLRRKTSFYSQFHFNSTSCRIQCMYKLFNVRRIFFSKSMCSEYTCRKAARGLRVARERALVCERN